MFPQRHTVRVPRRLRNKVLKAEQELAEQGVDVTVDEDDWKHGHRKARVARSGRFTATVTWEVLGHVWLVFSIFRAAVGAWPRIRKILVNAGLTDDEIMTLGLSRITRPPKKKSQKRATKKKPNR